MLSTLQMRHPYCCVALKSLGIGLEKITMSQAEGPPDLPYPKLPFWDAVSLSYSTYFNHFIDALHASWLWLIVVAAFTGFASWQQWSWLAAAMANLKPGLAPAMPKSAEISLLMNLDHILLLFAGVSIAVAWHRLMILNEHPGLSGSNIATKNLWRYVVAAIGLFLIMFLPVIAIMVPTFHFIFTTSAGRTSLPSAFLPLILTIFVAYAVGIAVAFRLTLLLPAQAIGNTGLTIKQVWTRTRGNIWRLFWGIVVTTIAPLLIAQFVFLLVMPLPHPGMIADGLVVRMTAFTTIFTTYYLFIVPIGIGFLSHAYRHFFQTPLVPAE
jgi:hypothetical protein